MSGSEVAGGVEVPGGEFDAARGALTIYEKHPDADAYRIGGSFTPYAIVAKDKRFSDAELAAAYWNARALGWPVLRANVLHRFASLPHFDEAGQ